MLRAIVGTQSGGLKVCRAIQADEVWLTAANTEVEIADTVTATVAWTQHVVSTYEDRAVLAAEFLAAAAHSGQAVALTVRHVELVSRAVVGTR